jgi:6-phosphogluconolactonase (cycloisomerase 2 family)
MRDRTRDEESAVKSHTRSILTILAIAAGALIGHPGAEATLPEPDHIVYGTPYRNGEPLTEGVVTARLDGEVETLASYVIGSNPALGGRFALRIPIDSIDPRLPGTARTGEAVAFFVDGVPAGQGVVGERGSVALLDLDEIAGGLPSIAIADLAIYEGNSGDTVFAFQVTLSAASDEDVTFVWQTAAGTAQGGIDFVEVAPGTVGTIGAGNTSTALNVTVKGETFQEDNETFFVNLSGPSANAVILDGQALGTILDDDRPPAISIADAAVIEGDSGDSLLVFELTTTRPINQPITVNWATAEGSADAPTDFDQDSGTATFVATSTSTQVEVTVHGDELDEDDETLTVTLSAQSGNATIADGQATGTILDDDGFLTWVEGEALSQLEEPLFGASGVAVSPDGAHVYVTGRSEDGVAIFDRDPVGGGLSFVTTVLDGDALPGGTVDGLDGAESVAVSPDGEHVYVAGFNDSALAVFDRDPVTGLLDFLEVFRDVAVGGTIDGLGGATAVVLSPDGSTVYVAGANDDAIVVFDRETSAVDPDFGELVFVQTVFDGGGVNHLDGVQALAVSAGGNHLYAAAAVSKAVATFSRNLATGALAFVEADVDGLLGVNGLDGANSLAIAPDGRHVYVAGTAENALATFTRDDATGALAFQSMLADGVAGAEGLYGATGVQVSFDNRFVYVLGFFEDALAVYTRDPVGGGLTFLEIHRDGFGAVDGLARPNELAVSADDQHLYVAAQDDDMVAVFMRDAIAPTPPGVLQSTSHTVGVFSSDPTVDMLWSGASDNPGGSGLAGYSFLFDATALTNVDGIVDLAHTVDPHTTTSPALADGVDYRFHFRVCDKVGNCTPTVHLGPYKIDQTAPVNPVTVFSTSHVQNVPTADDTIAMAWSAASDALSGVDGFAYSFDPAATPVCDQTLDLQENVSAVTSAALPDGSWWFHLCVRDNAGNWSSAATAGPYVVEVSAPEVLAVDTVADTGDDLLAIDEATPVSFTQLYVDFSEPMKDPAGNGTAGDVTNPTSYRLLGAGGDTVFSTAGCGALAGDDQSLAINSATWHADLLRAVLRINGGVPLPEGRYRLVACASLADAFSTPLAADFVLPFEVTATNRLVNPNFDDTIAGWTVQPAAPGTIRHDTADTDGSFTSGSVIAEFLSGTTFYGVSRCVPVTAGDNYEFGGSVRLVSGLGGAPEAFGQALFFGSPNCTVLPSPGGTEAFTGVVDGDTGGDWVAFFGAAPAPAAAQSAFVSFLVDATGAPDFDAYFDDLYFRSSVTVIFVSGFENGFAGWEVVPPP